MAECQWYYGCTKTTGSPDSDGWSQLLTQWNELHWFCPEHVDDGREASVVNP
jgi:hypothetical protein